MEYEQGGVHKKKFSDEIVNGEVFQMYKDMKVPLEKMRNDFSQLLYHLSSVL